MVKPEWGTKRTCPKCAARFYDLGKSDPVVVCIECSNQWTPEPVLKSKQPLPFDEQPKADVKEEHADIDLDTVDDESEKSADDEVDLDTGDDLGVDAPTGDDDV